MEKELKIHLTVEDLTKFILSVAPERTDIKNQENRYYTSDALSAAQIALRVRFEDGKYILTRKAKGKMVDGYSEAEETNELLQIGSFAEFEAQMGRFVQPAPERLLAHMRTSRVVFDLEGYVLECDSVRVLWPNEFVFAEIECETDDAEGARRIICSRLADCGISWEFSTMHKLARAIKGQ